MMAALSAEVLKYRRTLTLLLALMGPILLALLLALAVALTPDLQALAPTQKWDWLENNIFNTWSVLVLPLGTAILAALATNLEHADNHLKHILTLPPTRPAVYMAKLTAVLGLVLAGSMVLGMSFVLVGLLVGGGSPIPWDKAFRTPLTAFVGALPLLVLGVWLGMCWRSFAVGLGVGLGGTVAGLLALRSSTYWPYVPWTYPTFAIQPNAEQADKALTLAVILGIVVMLMGLFDFKRRDAP